MTENPRCQYKECLNKGYEIRKIGDEDILWAWLCFKHIRELDHYIASFWFKNINYSIDGDC